MNILSEFKEAKNIGIAGHIKPDGDCIGSCLGLYNYLSEIFAEDKKTIDLYIESVPKEFRFLRNWDKAACSYEDKPPYDIFVSLDCGSIDRLGNYEKFFKEARRNICIDHHISTTSFGMVNIVYPDASSTAEVLYDLFDKDKISTAVAECLYTGIVHDTGVFKHANTTEKAMTAAGKLITLGVKPNKIIDESFYQKTYVQNQILGRCLLESILLLDGKVIISYITKKMQEFYNINADDLKGVIDQLRVTKGVEVAVFIREESSGNYKVSMRSNGIVDVSKIAIYFGGGGHILAAGCNINCSMHDVINNLMGWIEYQLKNAGLLENNK